MAPIISAARKQALLRSLSTPSSKPHPHAPAISPNFLISPLLTITLTLTVHQSSMSRAHHHPLH